ncbi:MAG: methionine--tRNA ligase [bacterium]|nr:methionine--tRNA ligase [bacterium]
MFKDLFGAKKFYITTSIAYVNSEPHIGFALESVQADVLARYYRQLGREVFFLTGTDEHGSKIQRTAEANHKDPQEFVDGLSEKFKGLKGALNLSWDNFIRTTDQKNHWPVAQEIWNKLFDAGDLYKKKYGGYYCVGCESFKTGKDIVDGKCVVHKKDLEFIEDENWFFKLSKYTKEIEKKIKSDELKIIPETRKNEILSLLKEGLEDVSFSRSKRHLEWGIPVPNDDSQVMYVWADALANYISGYGGTDKWKKHPADVHMIGKDISRFHTAIWPGMLLSCGLPLPKNIFVHGFITSNGEKMSKSLGNVIDPYELAKKYGIDPVRYYLLREISSSEDGDFSYEKFEERYNGDLANGLGNFAARVSTLASREPEISGKISKEVKEKINEVEKTVEQKIGDFKFNEALASVWDLIQFGDRYVNENKPWVKDLSEEKRKEVLYNLASILKKTAELLVPFLPATAEKISDAIQLKRDGFIVKKIENLFPRL